MRTWELLVRNRSFSRGALREAERLSGETLFSIGQNVRRNLAEFPHNAAPRERFKRVIRNIDFPPEKALPRAGHVMMMVVVPAFAERHEREQPIVFAGVGSCVAAGTEKMRKRIDRERVMPEQRGTQTKTPEKERQSTDK